jgi:hypothetical protein
MFIKVKTIDSEGNEKGRAYTYESDIEVSEGDKVIADMAGSDKVLKVVGYADLSEIENAQFEIKKIKSIYTGDADSDGVLPEASLDISIEEESLPVIKINFDVLKTALTERLKNYAGIIVTEKNLQGCKATQKELAGLRTKIDTYRKDKKKALSAPITFFEDQCKELIALIEKAEEPIKEGIKVFDDKKRNAKYKIAEDLIKVVISEVGLNEKYGSRLDVSEKYCNLTAKDSDVKCDLEARALALKVEQDREAELLDIIIDAIDAENERLETKMKFEDFRRLVDRGMATKDVLAEIKSKADLIYKAEHPEPKPEPIVAPTPQPVPEPMPEIAPVAEEVPFAPEPIYYAEYRITGGANQLLAVSRFLKENGITYKVLDQGEIE